MRNEDRRQLDALKRLREAWVLHIVERMPPVCLFVTLTFKDELPPEKLDRVIRRLIRALNEFALGRNYRRKVGHSFFPYVFAFEQQTRGAWHAHGLLDSRIHPGTLYGFAHILGAHADVERAESVKDVAQYILKETGEPALFYLPRAPSGLDLAPSPSSPGSGLSRQTGERGSWPKTRGSWTELEDRPAGDSDSQETTALDVRPRITCGRSSEQQLGGSMRVAQMQVLTNTSKKGADYELLANAYASAGRRQWVVCRQAARIFGDYQRGEESTFNLAKRLGVSVKTIGTWALAGWLRLACRGIKSCDETGRSWTFYDVRRVLTLAHFRVAGKALRLEMASPGDLLACLVICATEGKSANWLGARLMPASPHTFVTRLQLLLKTPPPEDWPQEKQQAAMNWLSKGRQLLA